MNDLVKEFWDKQAEEHKTSDIATAPDHYYRELEIARILPHLTPGHASVLDIGCGNGHSTAAFARSQRSSEFLGADYSEAMIKQADIMLRRTPQRNLSFTVANVMTLHMMRKKFDVIISERCLINLGSWTEQKSALHQLKAALNPGGKLILVENTQEGLDNLNKLRLSLGLTKIETRWHNNYLPQQELMKFLRQHFIVQHVENIGNLYYIISRVVYAKMAAMEGKEPSYDHPINKIASELPSLPTYNFSPNFMFILRNS